MPGDYEAQVSQGPIAVHAGGQLGTTDKGVALYRRMLRQALRNLEDGREPPQLAPAANGRVPTMVGDVIVRVPVSNHDDTALQRTLGRAIGDIVRYTTDLDHHERRVEIERWMRTRLDAEASARAG